MNECDKPEVGFCYTMREFTDKSHSKEGLCILCGNKAIAVNQEVQRWPNGYECKHCGSPNVYGLTELQTMGMLSITSSK
jgi:predicted RNA-binding Zn-ribbon protein involved in translation (DUF1610 family)